MENQTGPAAAIRVLSAGRSRRRNPMRCIWSACWPSPDCRSMPARSSRKSRSQRPRNRPPCPATNRGCLALHRDDLAILLDERTERMSSRSSTASEGRHSLVPFGVSTIGRLIRIGCASMASISSSSLHLASPSPSSAYGVPFSRSSARTEIAHGGDQCQQPLAARRLSSDIRSPPALRRSAGSSPGCCARCRNPDCGRW